MKKIAFFLFLFSFNLLAHNMPDFVKKKYVINILIENEIFEENERASLEAGTFVLDFSEYRLNPIIYIDGGTFYNVDYKMDGDQDYEEFFFDFTYKNISFSLNCGLLTVEEINNKKVDSYKYTVQVNDCILKNNLRGISKSYSRFEHIYFIMSNSF
jgi:hypothetical protein